jgi:hypothetical protein
MEKNYFKIKTIILIFLFGFLLSFFGLRITQANSPDNPDPPLVGANIQVCVNPPEVDLTDPSQPIFQWTTSGNSQTHYWLLVDNNPPVAGGSSGYYLPSPELNTGAIASGNKFHQAGIGQIAGGQTYWWCIAVRDTSGSWTGWTGFQSFYVHQPPSATNLSVTQPDYCFSGPAATLSWRFFDPDSGDTQSAYRVQVDNNSNFSSPEVDSGKVISSSNSYATVPGALSYNTTYYWRLMVWDSKNLSSNWISGPSFSTPKHAYPTVNFSWAPLAPSVKENVQFADQSTVYGGATKSSWAWTFQSGNPSSSSQQNPTVKFTSAGPKTVTLRVTDSDGFACSGAKTVNIGLPLPKWKEVAPTTWIRKNFLAKIEEVFRNISSNNMFSNFIALFTPSR